MPAAIHVDREAGGYTDRARAYKVLVDGEERGTVKHGEGVEIEVEPGARSTDIRLGRSAPSAPPSEPAAPGEPAAS
jgi:hypothetical protein